MINIEFPALILHREKLYSLASKEKQSQTVSALQIETLVIYESNQNELSIPIKTMLEKLLSACKQATEQTHLINAHTNSFSLKEFSHLKYLLIFGNATVSSNLKNLPPNHIYEMNGLKIIRTETLEKLETNTIAKERLWHKLKTMFAI